MTQDKSLDGAYALQTTEDVTRLYADWAGDYDQSFAESHHYIVPDQLAAILKDQGGDPYPVLDIGAGTGLIGSALRATGMGGEIDAIDLSAEMLAVAEAKGIYRNHICADLTRDLPIGDWSYGALISAGTFTHGHVGPVCLPELIRIARPGAICCLSINAEVFDSAGFGSAFAGIVAEGAITPLDFRRIPYYSEKADHAHARDTGLVALFQRL